ncbi:hypothetical protein [Butyrivibrio sp. YAB3001]|uniref:hypothetical protein n=1 Tax=Butyrivibrio sp. YAB3001 TaxID=1520812 RepID=UPI0008F67F4E|nr:hypothetical protein [Butyrivibrio sp. YAB3001]SFC60797.1 hypothetical protein SAMN02910398_02676 [Butyrivibrio sp. YAB3001]
MEIHVKRQYVSWMMLLFLIVTFMSGSVKVYASSGNLTAVDAATSQAVEALKSYKGNTKEFNAYDYYINNADLQTAFGADGDALLKHYKEYGKKEGRIAIVKDSKTQTEDITKKEPKKDTKKTTKYTMRDGGRVWDQKLTGNLPQINGKTPVYLETWEQNTPAGMQIKLTVRDANYGIVCVGGAFDVSHTDYTYAYFTVLELVGNGSVLFEVAGSNEERAATDIDSPGYGTMETENGIYGTTSYYDY